MGSHRKRVEGRDGGNAETPRHNRGEAGVILDELALVYIIWERSHVRVTGERAGMPPRCTETTERLISGLTATTEAIGARAIWRLCRAKLPKGARRES